MFAYSCYCNYLIKNLFENLLKFVVPLVKRIVKKAGKIPLLGFGVPRLVWSNSTGKSSLVGGRLTAEYSGPQILKLTSNTEA